MKHASDNKLTELQRWLARILREQYEGNQTLMGERLGMSATTVGRLLSGETSPSVETLIALANATNTHIEVLIQMQWQGELRVNSGGGTALGVSASTTYLAKQIERLPPAQRQALATVVRGMTGDPTAAAAGSRLGIRPVGDKQETD